jgi:hypothetical protein
MCARVIARTYVQVSEQQLFSPFTSPACSPYFLVSSVAFPQLVVSETESICGGGGGGGGPNFLKKG